MGFQKGQISALFENEGNVRDANQAIDLLINDGGGWKHKYYTNSGTGPCKICGEEGKEHIDEQRKVEEQELLRLL